MEFPSGPALHRSRVFALARQPTSCQQPAPGFVLQAAHRERPGDVKNDGKSVAAGLSAGLASDRAGGPGTNAFLTWGHSVLVSPWRWRSRFVTEPTSRYASEASRPALRRTPDRLRGGPDPSGVLVGMLREAERR